MSPELNTSLSLRIPGPTCSRRCATPSASRTRGASTPRSSEREAGGGRREWGTGCALTGFTSFNAWRGMMVRMIVACEPHAPVSMLQPLDQHLQTRFVVEQDFAIKDSSNHPRGDHTWGAARGECAKGCAVVCVAGVAWLWGCAEFAQALGGWRRRTGGAGDVQGCMGVMRGMGGLAEGRAGAQRKRCIRRVCRATAPRRDDGEMTMVWMAGSAWR